ncbi:MAG: sulfotransferase [Bacteroidales bacterium]|jgi:hypothetical protein|nr:sulfotransferase [Bacteroidales bacterium]
MNLKELTNISLDDIYWRLKIGKSKKRVSLFELRSDLNEYIKNPVFFLSTGRCGTKWFSDLLSYDKSLMVLHNPIPNLAVQGKLTYEIISNGNLTNSERKLLKEIFFAGREQFLRYSFKTEKRYVETNNYITFFAPFLIELFPDAKFVHLYRHPGEFVRSGIRRNYYTPNNSDDIKRITPIDKIQNEHWKNYSQIEKTYWLWNETNLFIEKFKSKHSTNCIDFNFNNLTTNSIIDLLNFLKIDFKKSIVSQSLNKKVNVQKKGTFPKYDKWEEKLKKQLINKCNQFASKYYKL